MKKTLLALAAVAATSAAWAESSVTLWGIVDTVFTHGTAGKGSKNAVGNSGMLPSQLGFRGVEELGGGLKAGFWLEGWVNTDDGTGQLTNINNQTAGSTGGGGFTFNRRSTVSLGGDWGEVRLGRDYTPQFWNLVAYDPFTNVGVGVTQTLASSIAFGQGGGSGPAARASNSISYIYNQGFNNLAIGGAGFHALAMYYFGENASNLPNSKDGTGYGIRVGYTARSFSVAVGTGRTTYLAGDVHQSNIGASYMIGTTRLVAQYTRDKLGTISGTGYLIGGIVPAGAGYFRASYSHYRNSLPGEPATGKVALGYVYNMSKRTALYGTIAHVTNGGGATGTVGGALNGPNQSASGLDLGIKHSF
jgi:predicted porin